MTVRPGLLVLGLCGLLPLLTSCSPVYTSPPPPPPVPEPYRQPPRPYNSCEGSFDPCLCDIEKYRIDTLDTQLSEPNWSPARRQEVAANLSNVADYYKRDYWSYRRREDAVRALRYYSAFLSIVPLSEQSAPFAVLQSIAIYCNLGCRAKARDLVAELRSNYRYEPSYLETALRDCR